MTPKYVENNLMISIKVKTTVAYDYMLLASSRCENIQVSLLRWYTLMTDTIISDLLGKINGGPMTSNF